MENKNIGSFIELIETAIKEYWDLDALTDYDGATLQYKDVARKIEKLHILFSEAHVKKGDKIAICGRNSSQWAAAYLGILTYGAVAVPILQEFKPEQIYNIVNHSESKLLFVGDLIWPTIDANEMPDLEGIFGLPDYSLLVSRAETLTSARERLNEMFGHKFPKNFRKEHVSYRRDETEELAMINYTSGTTSNSKGVPRPMEQHGLCTQRAAHVRTQRQQARFHSANGPHVRHGLGILVRVHFRGTRVLPYEKPQPHCNLQCVCKNKTRLYCRRTVDS